MAPTNRVHIPQLTSLSGFTNFISGSARRVSTLAEPEVVAEPVLTDSSLGRNIYNNSRKRREREGDDEAVLLSTAKREKGREEIRRKERLAAQVTGWRHDRDVLIGSEHEVTGRGGKSQKPLLPSRGASPSAGSAWDSYLLLGWVAEGGDTNGK